MKVNQAGSQATQATSNSKDAAAAQKAKKAGGSAEQAKTQTANSGDAKTEISSKAKEAAKAKEVATNAPDVREEKIQELRRRIAEGKYKVDPEAVADKIVQDHAALPGA